MIVSLQSIHDEVVLQIAINYSQISTKALTVFSSIAVGHHERTEVVATATPPHHAVGAGS